MFRILHDTNYDFIKHWKTAAIGTVAFIALGLVLLVVHAARHNGNALNQSIEFTGGTVVQIQFQQNAGNRRRSLRGGRGGLQGSEVTTFGDARNYLIKVPPVEGVAAASNADSVGAHIVNVLKQRVPGNPAHVEQAPSRLVLASAPSSRRRRSRRSCSRSSSR